MKPVLPKLRRFADRHLDLFATEVHTFLQAVLNRDWLWGNIVTVTLQASTPLAVTHGLSRAPHGYAVIRKSSAAHVYDAPSDGDLSKLWVQSDADVTATLYVF